LRPRSRGQKQLAPKQANRVLMLGSIRELALYRAEVLRHYGFEALTPETVEEATSLIRRGNFDVAVLSYTLPDAAVQQLAQSLREHCPHCPILAIAQTIRPDRRIAPDAVVLAKNGPPDLVTALRKLLGQG
jgi:DNA-binding response OmpR family regulator